MEAKIDEIGDKIYRLSVFVPDVAPPLGFTYNHFLILGDEPLLFHCGRRNVSAGIWRCCQNYPTRLPTVAHVRPL
jgi:hypothetical protein